MKKDKKGEIKRHRGVMWLVPGHTEVSSRVKNWIFELEFKSVCLTPEATEVTQYE